MNFTSSEYLYPHSFTLPMVTCTVQKVGRKSVDFHTWKWDVFVQLLNIMVKRKFSENWSTVPSKTMIGVQALKLHFQLRLSLDKLQ